jgi:enoyl-CoA hydratase/carnithine racemase
MEFINIQKQENYAIVQLNRGTANSLNLQLLEELVSAMKTLENDTDVRGVVLTGKERFFSAGLDVIELFNYDDLQMTDLFITLAKAVKTLFLFEKPLVASITGHSPAGGCILAIGCDYRIMAEGNYKIGLNEIPVGIVMPEFIFQVMSYWIGKGKAFQHISEGKLIAPQDALALGLIDKVVPETDVLEQSIAQLKKYLALDANTWTQSKKNMRFDYLDYLDINEDKIEDMLEQWFKEETRTLMSNLVAQLTKR